MIDNEEWALVAFEACHKLVRMSDRGNNEMMEQFIFERQYRTIPYIPGLGKWFIVLMIVFNVFLNLLNNKKY